MERLFWVSADCQQPQLAIADSYTGALEFTPLPGALQWGVAGMGIERYASDMATKGGSESVQP